MPTEEVGARLSLKGRPAFTRDMRQASGDVDHLARRARLADRAGRGMGGAFTVARGAIRGIGSVARAGAIGVGILAAGVTALGVNTIQSLNRIETIGAQTEAAIRSTGGVANVTREQIDTLAGGLERLTSIEAESITEGANLLLTFTNIRDEAGAGNDVFSQSVEALANLSTALGTDAPAAALQLGKALNDPIRGITSLRRAGVGFTEAQQEQIKAMVEAGDVLGAQRIILGELETQFGGSAEALGRTATGRIRRIGHEIGTISEALLTGFLGPLGESIDIALGHLEGFADRAPEIGRNIGERVDAIWSAFRDGGAQSEQFASAVEGALGGRVGPVVAEVAGGIELLVGHVRDLGFRGGLVLSVDELFGSDAADTLSRIMDAFGALALAVRDDLVPALAEVGTDVFVDIAEALPAATEALTAFVEVAPGAASALNGVAEAVGGYARIGLAIAGIRLLNAALGGAGAAAGGGGIIGALRSLGSGSVLAGIGALASLAAGVAAVGAALAAFRVVLQAGTTGLPGLEFPGQEPRSFVDQQENVSRVAPGQRSPAGVLPGSGQTPVNAPIGGRASGGPVLAGFDYFVGERGIELLRMFPGGDGVVIPNPSVPTVQAGVPAVRAAVAVTQAPVQRGDQRGGVTVESVQIVVNPPPGMDPRAVAEMVERQFRLKMARM